MTSLINFFTHKFFKVLFVLYVGLFITIWAISSPVAKHFITPVLEEYKLALSEDSSIRFNPFLMRVTLSDIELSALDDPKKEAVLAFEDLTMQVALWQLVLDRVTLSEFSLTEGFIKVVQNNDELIIAGVKIPQAQSSTEEELAVDNTEEVDEETAKNSEQDVDYQFVLPNFFLKNFDIIVERHTEQQKDKTHHITIEQLALNQLKATAAKQEANFALSALVDQTHLSLAANTKLVDGKGDIHSNFRLDNYPLKNLNRYVEALNELDGTLALSSQQTLTITDNGISVNLSKANIGLKGLYAELEKQHLKLDALQYNLSDFNITLADNNITQLTGQSNIKLTDVSFNKNDDNAKISGFKMLNLAKIDLRLEEEPVVDIADIVLDEFTFSKKEKLTGEVAQQAVEKMNQLSQASGVDISAEALIQLPPVLHLQQLTLNQLHIQQNSLAIHSIIFDTLSGDVIIQPNKEIANLVNLADEPSTEAEEPATEETQPTEDVAKTETQVEVDMAEENPFIFSFNELRFINKNSFDFTDFSVDPIYKRTLHIDTLEVGSLGNSAEKQQEQTPYSLVGRSNKYANFKLDGYIQPFIATPKYHVNGDFKEFSLPAISTYMRDSTGLEVKTGQLNLDFDIDMVGDELDGNVIVLLQALETAMVDDEEAGNLISQGALPLNMAMGMLKDSDGNVELDVPLSGSTSDPQFGLSSIVGLITQKAILSATQDYLMTTFVPYANVVSIAISAGEYALKLRFDDLEYTEKQIAPNDSQSAYLNEFMALMKEKSDTRVTICAVSTPGDIGLPAGEKVTDKANIKQLIEIGEQREHALKDYLIEKGQIESSRILFCKPQIDSSADAVPHIAISV